MMLDTATYLGRGIVTRTLEGAAVEARLDDGQEVRVKPAMPLHYEAAPGDELLVLGADPQAMYAIGVLRGRGKVTLRAPGDLTLETPEGALRLTAARGVTLKSQVEIVTEAPAVRCVAGKLEIAAQRVIQRARDVYFWVSELFQVKSHRLRATADSTCHIHAQETHLRADQTVSIDGQSIHLG
jgi:hypothetical protein